MLPPSLDPSLTWGKTAKLNQRQLTKYPPGALKTKEDVENKERTRNFREDGRLRRNASRLSRMQRSVSMERALKLESTAACHRCFSTATNTLCNKRCQLSALLRNFFETLSKSVLKEFFKAELRASVI